MTPEEVVAAAILRMDVHEAETYEGDATRSPIQDPGGGLMRYSQAIRKVLTRHRPVPHSPARLARLAREEKAGYWSGPEDRVPMCAECGEWIDGGIRYWPCPTVLDIAGVISNG